MSRRHHELNIALTALVSAAAASGMTYFLYGTADGKLARRKIKRSAKKWKGKTLDLAESAQDSVLVGGGELAETLKEAYASLSEIIRKNKTLLKNIDKEDMAWLATRLKDRLEDVWEETGDDLEEVLEDIQEDE